MMRKDILLSIFYCESLLHILAIYAINVMLLIYAHVNFTKGGDWVMENQFDPVELAIEPITKKRSRCNSAAWLQIFGGVSSIGGIITAIATGVTGGLWLAIGGISVAVGGTGTFLTGWYKDSHSLSKLFCGTSIQEDINYERQKKIKKKNKIRVESVLVSIETLLDQSAEFPNAQCISEILNETEEYLQTRNPNLVEDSLWNRMRDVKNRFNDLQLLPANANQVISNSR